MADLRDVVLGGFELKEMSHLLWLWRQTLKSYMPQVEPEAGRFESLIVWLDGVIQVLEEET